MNGKKDSEIPRSLKKWFVVHFIIDILFALPLFFIPVPFLTFLGWRSVDPIASRIAAAALFGIGIESLLGRKGSIASFTVMLRLKLIWSSTAAAGLLIGTLSGDFGIPLVGIGLTGVFVLFNILWLYWFRRLKP